MCVLRKRERGRDKQGEREDGRERKGEDTRENERQKEMDREAGWVGEWQRGRGRITSSTSKPKARKITMAITNCHSAEFTCSFICARIRAHVLRKEAVLFVSNFFLEQMQAPSNEQTQADASSTCRRTIFAASHLGAYPWLIHAPYQHPFPTR